MFIGNQGVNYPHSSFGVDGRLIGPWGLSNDFTGGGNGSVRFQSINPDISQGMALVAIAVPSLLDNERSVCGLSNSGNTGPWIRLEFRPDLGNTWNFQYGAGSYTNVNGSPSPTVGKADVLIGVWRPGTGEKSLWVNGVKVQISTTDRTTPVINQFEVGNMWRNSPVQHFAGAIPTAAFLNYAPTDEECRSIASNVYDSLLEPQRILVPYTLSSSLVVLSDLVQTYKVNTTTSSGVTETYLVRGSVSNNLTELFAIRSSVSSLLIETFNTRSLANNSISVNYLIRSSVLSSKEIIYDVLASQITNALLIEYNVRTNVNKPINQQYSILSALISDKSCVYTVRSNIASETNQTFKVYKLSSNELINSYKIRGLISSEVDQVYQIEGLQSVLSNITLIYNIISSITPTDQIIYLIDNEDTVIKLEEKDGVILINSDKIDTIYLSNT